MCTCKDFSLKNKHILFSLQPKIKKDHFQRLVLGCDIAKRLSLRSLCLQVLWGKGVVKF